MGTNIAIGSLVGKRNTDTQKINFPFSNSLVDYWSFKGKSNFDKDRNTIKGIKGEILTAYNFGWSLGSGYGLYAINYNTYKNHINSRWKGTVTPDTYNIVSKIVSESVFVFSEKTGMLNTGETFNIPACRIRVSGIKRNMIFNIDYPHDKITPIIVIDKDGEYDIPAYSFTATKDNTPYWYRYKLTYEGTDIGLTIEQIPEYQLAIVTDGIDDYLKLDKVGYKIGTIIIKYVPISIHRGWNTVFDTYNDVYVDKCIMFYNNTLENWGSTMNRKIINDYSVFVSDTPKNVDVPLYLAARYENTVRDYLSMALYEIAIYSEILTDEEIQKEIDVMQYGTPNPVFALNFDNFAYKAVDYPDFATGKVTTNKIVVDSTTETFNGAIAVAMNPEADTGEPIEVPSYKIKVTGLNQYSVGEGNWAVGLMGMMIDSTKEPWTYPISKDGVYDIPEISLSDGIYNLGIMAQIAIDKPIEIEILYDKNVTKSFPETKQIFP